MKKFISLLLIFTFIFASLPAAYATDVDAKEATFEANLLSDLGIADFATMQDTPVSRAEFVRYAVSLSGIPLVPYVGTQFSDVASTDSDYPYIMSAVDFGMISIAPQFRPNDTITLNEAVKIMVKLLSYDFLAESLGGYPNGYLQTAARIELLENVGISSGPLSKTDACIILYNALNVKLPDVTYSNGTDVQYEIGDATILEKFRHITLVSGNVDGGAYYSKNSSVGLGDGSFSINGVVYNSGKFSTDSLLGYNIDAYIDTTTNTLISYQITETNKILTIYAEDINSYSAHTFAYTDIHGKDKTVSIDLGTEIIFNGKELNFDETKLIPESGSLTFISPDGSSVYSTLVIRSYKTIVVDRISASQYIIIDKYDRANNLTLDPSETDIRISNQNGELIAFEDIAAGDVLCAALSEDGKTGDIISVRDSFFGTYTGNGTDGIEIDGTLYKLTPAISGKVASLVTMGKQASFRFDIDGRIADIISAMSEGEEIGYLVEGKYIKSGMNESLKVRILNTASTIRVYEFAPSFSINSAGYKDFQRAFNDFKSSEYDSMICDIVKFTLDDNGKIRSLVYPSSDDDNGGLYETYRIENTDSYASYAESSKSIRKRIFADTDALIFRVPNPVTSVGSVDEDDYAVINITELGEEGVEGFNMIGYTTVADDGMAKYILMQNLSDELAELDIDATSHPRMVNSIKQVLVNGERYDAMELCDFQSGETPVTVYSEKEGEFTGAGIEPGDIVRVELKENNIVRKFELIYKTGSQRFENGTTLLRNSNATSPMLYARLVHAYDFKGDILEMLPLEYSLAEATMDDIQPYYMPLFKVLKYDSQKKCVVETALDDILDYKNFGNDCTKMIYHIRYSYPRTIFIVE